MGATYRGKAMRLAKYLGHAGVASRRAAEDLIRAGRVAVDGEVVGDLGRQLDGGEEIGVDGEGAPAGGSGTGARRFASTARWSAGRRSAWCGSSTSRPEWSPRRATRTGG